MKVEVAYGTPLQQEIIELDVEPGTTLIEAVNASGIVTLFPEINTNKFPMGVFGAMDPPGKVLGPWDRVEIYRPLLMDPKEARRRRAEKKGGV